VYCSRGGRWKVQAEPWLSGGEGKMTDRSGQSTPVVVRTTGVWLLLRYAVRVSHAFDILS
jgi:hypothetical protein